MTDARPFYRRHAVWIGIAVLFVALPYIFSSPSALKVMSQMGITIVFALAYNMLLGQSGMLSFGHAVFFGLSGYTAMHVMRAIELDGLMLPMVFLPVIGAAAGLFFGIIVGAVTTRRSGVTFAMISLGIGELVATMALTFNHFFGGEQGVSADRMSGFEFLGISLGPQIEVYYMIAAWCFACMIVMYAFTLTPLGRMANAVRDNPERVAFIGYNPQRVRFLMFSLSGMFAGVAGGLYAVNFELMTPENVGEFESASVLIATYIGGLGHFFGPVIGAVVMTWLSMTLSDFTQAWLLYLGLFFLIVVLYLPYGLAGLFAMHDPVRKAGLLRRLAPSYARVSVPALAMIVGAMLFIEMNYHLSRNVDEAPEIGFFGLTIDASSTPAWVVSLLLFGGGLFFLRRAIPAVAAAWGEVHERMKSGGGS